MLTNITLNVYGSAQQRNDIALLLEQQYDISRWTTHGDDHDDYETFILYVKGTMDPTWRYILEDN